MDRIEIVDEERKIARRVPPVPEAPQWFAMSAPYSGELKAAEALRAMGIESYVPMRYEIIQKGAVKKKLLVPAIHNLIFVHAPRTDVQAAKGKIRRLQYHTIPSGGRNVPIVVPDKQMEDFMRVCGSTGAGAAIFAPGEVQIPEGARVRIIGGELSGVEGRFVRLSGKRRRTLVVEIPFVASAVLASLTPDLVEVLDQ